MKKLIFALITVLAFTTQSFALDAAGRENGKDWQSWRRPDFKALYVLGFLSGTGFAIDDIKGEMEEEAIKAGRPEGAGEKRVANYDFSGMNLGEIIDGVDSFYSDPQNMEVAIPDAIYLTRKFRTGTPPEDVRKIILYLRGGKDPQMLEVKGKDGKVERKISFP